MVIFRRVKETIKSRGYRSRVKKITVRPFINNCSGSIYMTDLLLQGGSFATAWVGHPSEIRFTLDG